MTQARQGCFLQQRISRILFLDMTMMNTAFAWLGHTAMVSLRLDGVQQFVDTQVIILRDNREYCTHAYTETRNS